MQAESVRRRRVAVAMVLGLMLATACSETTPTEVEPDENTLLVDASTDWAFVALGPEATQVVVTDRASSAAWDIAFNATRVMLNGGAAGPGGVVGYCLCGNAGASDAEIQAMTPAGELSSFEAVSMLDVPEEASAWESDALDAAIAGWYSYDMTTHQVTAAPENVWKLRGAGDDPAYVKLHVIGISDATQAGAQVTIEYAVQPDSGAAMGAVQTVVLDGRTEPAYFDFETGAASEQEWDMMLDGYDIRINGGVSGTGEAGAVLADESFDAMTDASDAPAQIYRGDAFGGVFAAQPWYRYDLDGNHTIFPTYDVYLIDVGDRIYKVQIIGYYSTTGESRRITFRYAPLQWPAD